MNFDTILELLLKIVIIILELLHGVLHFAIIIFQTLQTLIDKLLQLVQRLP